MSASVAPLPKPAKSGEVAKTGREGETLSALVDSSQDKGLAVLSSILSTALGRLAEKGTAAAVASRDLFNAAEMAELSAAFAAVISTGSLMGHSHVRITQVTKELTKGRDTFAEPIAIVQPEAFPILPPYQAIEYFRNLIPRLGVDPIQWAPLMQRTAFTLAAATEVTLVDEVHTIILDRLRTGEGFSSAPKDIQDVIDAAGCSQKNPQYAQMVFRTNAMESYTTGYQMEMEHPEVKEFFPAWLYMGILDGRQGKDHEIRFNKYYPNSLPFAVVRGKRVFNCRCLPNAIDKYKWARLVAAGAQFSSL